MLTGLLIVEHTVDLAQSRHGMRRHESLYTCGHRCFGNDTFQAEHFGC